MSSSAGSSSVPKRSMCGRGSRLILPNRRDVQSPSFEAVQAWAYSCSARLGRRTTAMKIASFTLTLIWVFQLGEGSGYRRVRGWGHHGRPAERTLHSRVKVGAASWSEHLREARSSSGRGFDAEELG